MSKVNTAPLGTRSSHGKFISPEVSFAFDDQDERLCKEAENLSAELKISLITAKILVSRGVRTVESARRFLNPTLKQDLPDPNQIKNIVLAAKLILDAIDRQEVITVYTDFDVDGLTSGAQLGQFLQLLGGEVHIYVPNRFVEGYGLAQSAVEKIAAGGSKLLITVDCGISSVKEIELAKKRGLTAIVVDHHEPGLELPPADAIVDPAQPDCPFQPHKLAAAGLVWMLLIVLRAQAKLRYQSSIPERVDKLPDVKDFLDLAAIGTICDMVPLTGVNRLLAFRGIEALQGSSRVGITALKEVAGLVGAPRFGAGHVSFGIGPRINAAGRLDDASQVVTLLTTKDSKKAKGIAEAIDQLNEKRKSIEDGVRSRCVQVVLGDEILINAPAIAIFDESFHLGVIGIAAQRLVEEFHRPAAVMGPGEITKGSQILKVIKGSVRSIEGFHIAEVLQELKDLLVAGGGHAQAGGFTLEVSKLELFQQAFIEAARKRLTQSSLRRVQKSDVRVRLSEVDFVLVEELNKMSPFGVGNATPVLVSEGIFVDSAVSLSGKHVRLRLSDGSCARNGVGWGLLGHPLLRKGVRVGIAFQPELNSYQGISSVQLNIKSVWEA